MPYTSNIWVWWGKGGELTSPIGTSPHTSGTILHAYHPPTYPLQIPHISLLCTVCDAKTFLTQQKRIYMQFEWIGTKYQPVGKDSNDISPSFLQHLPQVCQVGHNEHTTLSKMASNLYDMS